MKTDNELIEEFFVSRGGGPIIVKADLDFYENSWDMLMPVVAKIHKLYEAAFPSNEEFTRKILAHEDPIDDHYVDIVSTSICTPINEVHEAVVKFIKWYNSNPPTKIG